MRRQLFAGSLVLGCLSLAPGAQAAQPSGEMLAASCAACHGTSGSSVGITPSLAGISKEYFIETMQAFKDGSRKATVMDRIAKGYTDVHLKTMADYFSVQPLKPMKQTVAQAKASTGKQLHRQYCEKCHEDGGRKSDDGGILAGQSMLYLTYSMQDFKAGDREAPKKMRAKVREMLQEHGQGAVESVIHYYGSQQ